MRRWIVVIVITLVIFVLIKGRSVFSFLSIPDTVRLESVESKIVVSKKAVVVLKEKVIFSPYGGKITYFYKEGERIAKNSLVAEVETDNGSFKLFAPESGIFSRMFDDVSFDDNLNKTKIKDYLKNSKTKGFRKAGNTIQPGEPAFRIIDNLNATLFVLNDDTLNKLIKSREIFIEDEIRGEEIPIYLNNIEEELIEFKILVHVEDFINNRTPVIKIVVFKGKVIKIPKRFIKHKGIMIRDKDNSIFISLENLFFIKDKDIYMFPLVEENKNLFKFLGKNIIKE